MTVEEKIRQDVERRIHSGEWRPGHRIPFEHELVAVYGCSRATVNKALSSLARGGLIERRRKAGSFVARPQVHSAVLEVPDLAQIVSARGEVYGWSLQTRTRDLALADFPYVTLFLKGVHASSGEPLAVEERWINLEAVPEADLETFHDVSPGSWLLHHIPWTTARHTIRAVAAEKSEAATLRVPQHTACLELWRSTWRGGEPITRVRQLFRGDRYDLTAEFHP